MKGKKMKNKKNSKIWLILSSISALTAILPLAAISCDHKVKQNSKENKEDLKPDQNKPNPKPEDKKPGTTPEVKPEDKPGTTPEVKPEDKPEPNPEPKPEPKPENPTKEEDSLNFRKNFKFELTKSNTWKITKFIGNDSKVTIPGKYQGKNITEIGNGAFSNSFIHSVSITGSIKEIGERAFLGCRNLKEVILNEGLEKIGVRAFLNTKIESITIPNSVKEIDSLAFDFLKISHISINLNNKNFEIKDNFFIDKNNKKILAYLDKKTTKVTIPSSIKEIDESAFLGCRNLKEVILNEGLEKIRAGAFFNTNIKSITIPDSVKEIDGWAFNFSKISHISINSNNKNLEIKDNFLIDKNNKKILAYLDKKTTKVTIPDSVKEIGEGAFSGCRNLKEVILNEGLEKIGAGVFLNTNIESITIPDSVKEIGSLAFNFSKISHISINSNNKNLEIKDNFLIDKNNKKILAYLDKKTTKVTIPGSVKEIGESAFFGCENLKEVILNEGLEKIGAGVFLNTNIESITIPGSVKEIGESAFFGCENLKEVILNEGLEKIGASAFPNTNIESITIPGSVKEIGKGAFSSCKNLKEVIYKGDASNINWENIGIDKTKTKIISSNN
ncbi:leucine-rich repeat domain-containing protein [Metamycoplasma hominis]|uniref:leucine-rich repeat domain-containing protein n=2 Tax=Metamycoplasma hominis TaxID=2098 RepID=UPI00159389F9|nr:leucine-rich repeat domain-containing protein [Metamycoplasma hominis]QKX37165.1 leucine-rich repeat domain-containing protein [Metamycoplasma hominis]